MLSVVMLSVVMLNAIELSGVAPIIGLLPSMKNMIIREVLLKGKAHYSRPLCTN